MCFISKTEMFKIIVVLIVLCYTQSSEGACLNYGHSCLGAHGKRDQLRSTPARDDSTIMEIPIDIRWFLTKLYGGNNVMDVPGLRYQQRQRENDFNEYIQSFPEDNEIKEPEDTYIEDEYKVLKDIQFLNFLKNRKFFNQDIYRN
ncbi:uncharacterized protein [Onthophagus taurus]|uniref:uncharacterized protein isoform X2 n=1 Tax=Onthophagus taurus TaxID=166361 RepID=UPI000C201B58|nr:uncharacterized protein LOC111419430 isoform X2 [Onthophagus taurus]